MTASTFANRTMVKAYWHIIEDYPKQEGEYVVGLENSSGETYLDIWEFTETEGWLPVALNYDSTYPKYWCDLPTPQ